MKVLNLERKEFLFDDEDFEIFSILPVSIVKKGRNYYLYFKDTPVHQMVAAIAGIEIPPGFVADHKNRNSQDNQRKNIRPLTQYENLCLNKKKVKGSSKYIGVSKCKEGWKASISYCGSSFTIGKYDTEEKAALHYDLYCISVGHKCVRLNFPEEVEFLVKPKN